MAFGVDDAILISLIASAIGAAAKGVASNKAKNFKERQQEYQERQQKKAEKKARMDALAAAIGDKTIYAPKPMEKPPEEPDYTAENIVGGVADIGAQAASAYAAGGMGAPSYNPGAVGAVTKGATDVGKSTWDAARRGAMKSSIEGSTRTPRIGGGGY